MSRIARPRYWTLQRGYWTDWILRGENPLHWNSQEVTAPSLTTQRCNSEIAQLKQARALLSSDRTQKTATHVVPKKRKMSAAARKRIGDAQRKRWTKQKATATGK
jgi:hypothetical protein